MIKFPSISQYRNAIHNVKHKAQFQGRDESGEAIFDYNRPLPTLKYQGTVKLHGTNASIVYDVKSMDLSYQSRERELTLQQDNAGFMLYMMNKETVLRDLFSLVENQLPEGAPPHLKNIAIFGEWCGQGIQKSVAIAELPKMFVIFAVKTHFVVDGEDLSFWAPQDVVEQLKSEDDRIFNVYQFPTFEVDIDFNHPEYAQEEMVKITEQVEAECPVGKHFGVSGCGEGVVWIPVDLKWKSPDHWFKVKGEKHSVSKVKTLAPVDIEAVRSLNEFVDNVVTEARLEQGLHNLINEQQKPFEMTSMGDFIRWVFNDIVKEESDTIVANQFNPKQLGGPIATKSRLWFINKLNSEMELAA